ncbi:arsenite efflux transporter metallochaperone ArsD [Nocardia sp. CC227C]|uniref:arsenite efflux transporter metallochaperone ArsD n=1 Tax=Nocardia sp. CC227C TaxID=3044562 RepID=UPI00278C479C|nr:arsenite efflux transporter metallochaperone ArsD [Nocardia sp. CC227C]
MSTIEIFEPALCCNTGICGPEVDQSLVEISADLDWVTRQGGTVTRHNLAGDPMAFAADDTARRFLELTGSEGLPLVLVDGVTVLTGRYPTRRELARWAGLPDTTQSVVTPPAGGQLLEVSSEDCCGPDGRC